MKAIKTILLLAVVMMIFGCGPRVRTVNPDTNNLSNYETFAYLPNTNAQVEGMSYNNENVNRSIVEAVRANLRQEGFELERNNPDLLVLISTATDREIATTTDPVYATYPYTGGIGTVSPFYEPYYYRGYGTFTNFAGYDIDTYAYKEGTLVVHLIDRKTKNTVWKGVATDAIYNQTSPDAIRSMVNDIFQEFPGR